MKPETWLPIPGYEGQYDVCNLGFIRSVDRTVNRVVCGKMITQRVPGKVLKATPNADSGHMSVTLCRNGIPKMYYVHILVAESFIGPRPPNMHVCHNDGIPANNWEWNLRYDTPTGNAADRKIHGTDASGENNPSARFTEDEVILLIGQMTHKSLAQISRDTGIPAATLSSIKTGKKLAAFKQTLEMRKVITWTKSKSS